MYLDRYRREMKGCVIEVVQGLTGVVTGEEGPAEVHFDVDVEQPPCK